MRILAFVVVGLVVLPPMAHADQREELQAKGEQLAKEARFGEAIDAFKAADRLQPRASHACLIALAYTRKEAWPQAEMFLSICHQRANAGDPLPDWVPLAEQQIKDRLSGANVAAVKIDVRPAGVAAKVTVSSFAPDEVFDPGTTIHLPFGTHVIFSRAQGYPEQQVTVQIKDKTAQQIVIDQAAKPAQSRPVAKTSGMVWFVAGGVSAVLGGAAHGWLGYEGSQLEKARTLPLAQGEALYQKHSGRWDVALVSTVSLYTIGAALIVTGFLKHGNEIEQSPTVSAGPMQGGGVMVTFGWQR